MKCREVKFDLHLYADGELSDEAAAALSAHLDSCPLCRAELSAIGSLRSEMRMMQRPEISASVYRRLRETISAEFAPAYGSPTFRLIEGSSNWVKTWMMPTMVGTTASVILGLALLAVILIPSNIPIVTIDTYPDLVNDEPLLLASVPELTPFQYARSRSNISDESPSVNPSGTLVTLTNSLETNQMDNDEEVVVVADVFENGAARVTNVVESPKSRSTMARLMRALDGERTSPPFVPASLDNRGDLVRVVLKFQSVNVNINESNSFR
jgi:Putative zinc-finger